MKKKNLQLALITSIIFFNFPKIILAEEGDVLWKKNFGGNRNDYFTDVTAVSDGIVAVGYSDFNSFGNGDWETVIGKGNLDAIIVKYDNLGNVLWKNNFGGSGADCFESVATVFDGVVAVGYSDFTSFENGDWVGFERKGIQDAIIVKFDNEGNVLWKHNFGGKSSGYSSFHSVDLLLDGIIAVGYSNGFGAGDLEDVLGKGSDDAIVVKYDIEGNIVWKTNFGGADIDKFFSVTVENDSIVAVGVSFSGSFENGDWEADTCWGGKDAIMVKFDPDGKIVWKRNFGGSSDDFFYSVTTVSNGIIAAGISFPNSFGTGNWKMDTCRGWEDAIIVKYDSEGNIVWKKNFGGAGWDCFNALTRVTDGIIAVGSSDGFNSGDWKDFEGNGSKDAIIVMFDNNGNVLWKKNFGGSDVDVYSSVIYITNMNSNAIEWATKSDIVAVGCANFASFKTGDWIAINGKGWEDAIIVKYADVSVGIMEQRKEVEKIKVCPNPTTGELRIETGEWKVENLELFDVYGRKIYSISFTQHSSLLSINISHLRAGVYFLKVNNRVVRVVKW